MTVTQLESDIALTQRAKAAKRIALATAGIMRTCGVKVVTPRKAVSSVTRNNVYRVEGFDGDIIGVDGLRGWLWDHGVKDASTSAVTKAASTGKPYRGFVIRFVGQVDRNPKRLKFQNPEAV